MKHPTAVAAACFTTIALVLVGPSLLGRSAVGPDIALDKDPLYRTGNTPAVRLPLDLTPIAVDWPREATVAAALQRGRLQKWNPLSAAGIPLWAEQGGPFFPLKIFFYLAPGQFTYTLFLASRLVLAALGAYFLARFRGLTPGPAMAAGAVFELSGPLLMQLPFANCSATPLLPWAVLGSFWIARRQSAAAVVAAAVILGLAGHGGHPSMIAIVYAAFAAAAIGHTLRHLRAPRVALRIAASSALAVILGLALAAPVLLPLAELTSVGDPYKFRPEGQLWTYLRLQVSRRLLPIATFTPDLVLRHDVAFAPLLGGATLWLAMLGVLVGGFDAALFAVALLGVSLATAPPVLGWLYTLPGVGIVQAPYTWSLLVLPLTQAVGHGVQALPQPPSRRVLWLAVLAVTIGTVAVWLWGAPLSPPKGQRQIERQTTFLAVAAVPILAALACGATMLMRWLGLAAACAAVIGLLAVGEQLVRAVPRTNRYPVSHVLGALPSPPVRFLQERMRTGDARFTAAPHWVGHPMTGMLFGLADLRHFGVILPRRYFDYLKAINPTAFVFAIQSTPVLRSPLLDRAAIRYLVVPREREEPAPHLDNDPQIPLRFRDEAAVVYENESALPRVRIVHQADVVADYDAALAAIRTRNSDGAHVSADESSNVIVEPDDRGTMPPGTSAAESAGEQVRIVDASDADALLLEAELNSPGFVIVADTYYPGWRAWVDGSPTPIYPADLLFRAVFVPAGRHTIVMRYEPRSFQAGVAIFSVASLVCAGILIRARRRARMFGG